MSQLRAEVIEARDQLAGLQETLAQANEEKDATSKELASCRDELSKATGGYGGAFMGTLACALCAASGPAAAAQHPERSAHSCHWYTRTALPARPKLRLQPDSGWPNERYCCAPRAAAGTATDVSNELVTCQQYSGPLAAQLQEANTHLSTCEADLQHCLTNNIAVASGR